MSMMATGRAGLYDDTNSLGSDNLDDEDPLDDLDPMDDIQGQTQQDQGSIPSSMFPFSPEGIPGSGAEDDGSSCFPLVISTRSQGELSSSI